MPPLSSHTTTTITTRPSRKSIQLATNHSLYHHHHHHATLHTAIGENLQQRNPLSPSPLDSTSTSVPWTLSSSGYSNAKTYSTPQLSLRTASHLSSSSVCVTRVASSFIAAPDVSICRFASASFLFSTLNGLSDFIGCIYFPFISRQVVISSACVLFHRFYMRNSLVKFHHYVSSVYPK